MIRTCLREAATPLHLLGLYQPLTNKRPSPQSLMYSASQKCLPLLRRSISSLRGNQPWCIMHKLATPQELAWLPGPRGPEITGGLPRSHLTSQRGMPSKYGLKLRWDLDTSYLQRTTPVPRISPLKF